MRSHPMSAPHRTTQANPERRPAARVALAITLAAWAIVSWSHTALAQTFTEIGTPLATTAYPCIAFGDIDGDGDPDALVTGLGRHDVPFSTLYLNTADTYSESAIALAGLSRAAAAWGDFDGDGDLDLAMTGLNASNLPTTRLYRNDGATFTALPGTFLGVCAGSVAWGDADGDGDLDVLVNGITSTVPGVGLVRTRLYRNDAGVFTSVAHPFPDCYVGSLAWGDYDGDGRADLAICGADAAGGLTTQIWHNGGAGVFTNSGAVLPGNDLGPLAWGDYDNDGDLDLLLGGNSNDGFISRIYRNDAGTFVDAAAGLQPLLWSSGSWGDYDNDGDLDLALSGYDAGAAVARSIVYRNDAGTFVDSGLSFHDVYIGTMCWVDYDGDGDLDLLLAGNEVGANITSLNRNNTVVANAAPSAPGGLAFASVGGAAVLSWDAASDDHTPASGLTYAVRVGTTPGGGQVVAPQSIASGARQLHTFGNAGGGRVARVEGLVPGTQYYWSVQAVDGAYRGSAFASEGTFVYGLTDVAPGATSAARKVTAQPNPFRGGTALRFTLSAPARVRADVFDAAGRRVRSFEPSSRSQGEQQIAWDGTDDAGRRVPAGVYLYRVDGAGGVSRGVVVKLD